MTTAAGGAGTPDTPAVPKAPEKPAAADGKTPETPAAAATPAAPATPAAELPPEKYTLTVPDTAKGFVDDADLEEFAVLAKGQKWTQAQAQQALEEQAAGLVAQSQAYRTETEANTTYGGEKLVETQLLVTKVLDRFAPAGDPLGAALRRDLARSGYSNKLSVVALFARIGKAMAEDSPLAGGAGAASSDPATRLYGEEKPAT